MPLGNTSSTSPPSVVVRLESVTLCPCAFSPELEDWSSRLLRALPALIFPSSAEICELAFELREFFTVPSVDADSASTTTTEIGSWTCVAFTSVLKRVSIPSSIQMDPGVRTSAAFSARTRSIYAFNAASGGLLASRADRFLAPAGGTVKSMRTSRQISDEKFSFIVFSRNAQLGQQVRPNAAHARLQI